MAPRITAGLAMISSSTVGFGGTTCLLASRSSGNVKSKKCTWISKAAVSSHEL